MYGYFLLSYVEIMKIKLTLLIIKLFKYKKCYSDFQMCLNIF